LLAGTNVAVDRTNLSYLQVSYMLFIALYTIAVGTGGIKPNVSSFGADQFDEDDPDHVRDKKSFFNWFYMFINLGSLMASTVVVYIQQEVSWTIGFVIPAACMFLATCIFFLGKRRYVRIKPAESPILRVLKVVFSATSHLKEKQRTPGGGIPHNVSYAWLESAVTDQPSDPVSNSNRSTNDNMEPSSVLQERQRLQHKKKGQYTHEQVEEVRLVVRLFPMFLATCFYWTVYSQMATLFVSQGIQMDTRVQFGKSTTLEIPPASLSSFDTISILVLIPLYDQGLVPLLKRCKKRITVLQRIGVGLVLATVSMVVAGTVEMRRLRLAHQGRFTPDGSVDMSVFWQTFQYLLVGASEVFAAIGQLELFYDQAPDSMRSCCSALALLSTAMGGYIAGGLIPLINAITSRTGGGEWIPSNLNDGRLDLFFYTIAGLNTLNFVYFLYVAMNFKHKTVAHGSGSGRSMPEDKGTSGEAEGAFARTNERTSAQAIPSRIRRRSSLERTPIRSLMPMPESPALPAPLR